MRVNEAHQLIREDGDPEVRNVPSPRNNSLDEPFPLGIVWHWTGGRGGTSGFAPALAEEIRTYKQGDRPASWHVLIAKDGRLFQSVSFARASWHVGRPGRISGRLFGNINRATVGVELENAGKLELVAGKYYCWPFWRDPDSPPEQRTADPSLTVAPERAVAHSGQLFDGFPPAQEASAVALLKALVLKYKWARTSCVYGHRDFDPGRKEDPGDLWQQIILPRVLDQVFGPVVGSAP